ncbi:hypothetical protein ANN_08001 [Periplaneta americana]|uniref:HAT C-terminal dimerisation domain-containing protein n=1 Tax=Periplaneta americana TaxID=6978 RepID=A0ABQ8T066_PERAM|nr:hypothetical protein ANN_08001 [Periplaneta americana]
MQMNTRFENIASLKFIELLDSSKFLQYENEFPTSALTSLQETYGSYFDTVSLRSECNVIFKKTTFQNMKSIREILDHITSNGLQEVLPELYKLCNLILTIPVTTAEVERSFSTLKRIKTYARSTMSEDRLSGLDVISIEKEMLKSIKTVSTSTFYDAVIEEFVKKERRLDFIYK